MRRKFNLYGMGISDYIYMPYHNAIFQPMYVYNKKTVVASEIEKYCADKRRKSSNKINFIEVKLKEYADWCEKNNHTVGWTRYLPVSRSKTRETPKWFKNFLGVKDNV